MNRGHLTRTEMGLQVHSASAAVADREHRQPRSIRPAGRNSFRVVDNEPEEVIVPAAATPAPATTPWERTYCTATEAAHHLGYADFRDLRRYVAAGLLQQYFRPLSNRPLYKRAEVEALIKTTRAA